MEPSPLCTGGRRSKAGAIGQPREYAAPAGKALQTGPAARGRAPLAFVVDDLRQDRNFSFLSI